MGFSNSQPDQNQHIQNSHILGSVNQAGRDVKQTLIQVFLCRDPSRTGNFLRHNLEPISFLERPWQFVKILLLLIQLWFFWLSVGWRIKFRLPTDLAWDLIESIFKGELIQSIADLQAKNDEQINKLVQDENNFSLEEKIALEAQIKLCFDLIQNLASGLNQDRQESISDFLTENQSRLSWFSSQIDSEKRERYRKLYDLQARANKRSKVEVLAESYINHLIASLSICGPSPLVAYDLIEEVSALIDRDKKSLSMKELKMLKSLKKFLFLISEKFMANPWDEENSLQRRYNSLRQESSQRDIEYQSLLSKTTTLESKCEDLQQQKADLEKNIEKLNTSQEKLRQEQRRMQDDPAAYLSDHWKIKYIASRKGKVYHHNPTCQDWCGFAFRYIMAKKHGLDEVSDFIVSASSTAPFKGMSECSHCNPNSSKK